MPLTKNNLDLNALPLVLRYYPFSIHSLHLPEVYAELLSYIEQHDDNQSATWGYFPEILESTDGYPHSLALLQNLQTNIFSNIAVRPAFVRLATTEPISNYGGLHIDVSSGVGHRKQHDHGEILRILINIGSHPRSVQYCPMPVNILRTKYEMYIPEDTYLALRLPSGVPLKTIDIPPHDNVGFYALCFISSQIVHSGITNKNGHFLASFGGVMKADEALNFLSR